MIDDYKFSPGRMVVYDHPDPKLPRQSYGHFGHTKTIGEVTRINLSPIPEPHWEYTVRNIRNGEVVRIGEERILFATDYSGRTKKHRSDDRPDRAQVVELIARVLNVPAQESLLRSALKDMLVNERTADKKRSSNQEPAYEVGDYIRVRGDLRPESEIVHNHYAKIVAVEPSDIAGIEIPNPEPGHPTFLPAKKKYTILTSENIKTDIYDTEVKVFYTARKRKIILNWRAATLLAEAFHDDAPYNLEFEFLADHVYTREELVHLRRSEMVRLLAGLLYVKGKMGWRDFQRKSQIFTGTPKTHLVDKILEISRFDSRHNRSMTKEEIINRRKQAYKLRRLLKSG